MAALTFYGMANSVSPLIAYVQKLGAYEEVAPRNDGIEDTKVKVLNPDSNLHKEKP